MKRDNGQPEVRTEGVEAARVPDPRRFSRRWVLALFAGGFSLAGAFVFSGCGWQQPSFAGALASIFFDTRAAATVGATYLRRVPQDAQRDRLVELICGEQRAIYELLASDGVEKLHKALNTQHRRDLLEGRHTRIEGWLVSETEARLCALATILSRSGEASS